MHAVMARETDIEIIGSIDETRTIGADKIVQVLQSGESDMEHGGEFTGRPGTRIFHNEQYLVKLHMELQFTDKDVVRWIIKKLETEREYQLYHPQKTWFVLNHQNKRVIANISPFMTGLHLAKPLYSADKMRTYIAQTFEYSIRILHQFDRQLDGGLSNFAIDQNHQLYYVDDDFYSAHQFSDFCNIIGVYLRAIDWLSETDWQILGGNCRSSMLKHFKDEHWLLVITEQIKDLFMANDFQRANRQTFVSGLMELSDPAKKTGQVDVSFADEHSKKADTKPVRLALLADVHANYEALKVVVDALEKQQPDQVIVLGDIVGYGPQPNECIELLRELGWTVIKGNHDHALVTGNLSGGFSSTGRWVIEWTKQRIKDDNKKWLADLPAFIKMQDWLLVHGSPLDKTFFNAYVYRMTYENNLDNMQQRNLSICFHGHSHVQGIYHRGKAADGFIDDRHIPLNDFQHSLICPGSVGQPRSNHPGAEFAIYEQQSNVMDFYRLDYDMSRTIKLMKENQFPETLYNRLELGQ